MKLYESPLSLKEEIRISSKTTSRVLCSAATSYVLFIYVGVLKADLGMQYISTYHVAFLLGIFLDLCVIGIVVPMFFIDTFVSKYLFE